ncbi:MAG: 4Fe-4S binding protein [Sphaerochaeta sp.]|nr:4Fe-4S binding protein [Sphaerochaeta sp.]
MHTTTWELRLLKALLWMYIGLGLIIASLNWGYVPSASPKAAHAIESLWHFYENWFKTLLIVVCSVLTLRIRTQKGSNSMRKKNLVGFTIAALLVHIILPILLANPEVYYFAMPLPWSTVPLQAGVEGTSIQQSLSQSIGLGGIRASILFFWIYSSGILVGTLLFGRRLQCSTLCLFNGFAAEIFEPAIPLVGTRKPPLSSKYLTLLSLLRKIFFLLALFFTLYWTTGAKLFTDQALISQVETYKYLIFELLMAMFFWVAFIGRLYCYYCPLGTLLGWIGRLGGQKILTDEKHCIQCGRCTSVCPLSIDVKSFAKNGIPVDTLRCVGCGHCVDACPTKTLKYTTHFMRHFHHAVQ